MVEQVLSELDARPDPLQSLHPWGPARRFHASRDGPQPPPPPGDPCGADYLMIKYADMPQPVGGPGVATASGDPRPAPGQLPNLDTVADRPVEG